MRADALAAFCLAAMLALGAGAGVAAPVACRADAVRCCEAPTRDDAGFARTAPALGVHVWPSSLAQNEAARARLAGLKPAHLRFSLGPNWRRQTPLDPAMSDAELDAAVAAGFASVTSGARQIETMRQVAETTGAALHLVVWEPPPLPGEPDFTAPGAPEGRVMAAANVDLAARFQVANLRHIAAAGLKLDAIELSNEPDGAWNIRIAPPLYLALVRAVRQEAARRGVTLPAIYGPGASRVQTTRAFFTDEATGTGILDAVDVVSLHGWDDAAGFDRFAALDKLRGDFARLGRTPTLAVTEFAVARPVPGDRSEAMNARLRRPDSVALTPFYAALTVRDTMRLLAGGVGPVIYWEFQDQSWGKGALGLYDVDGAPKPVHGGFARLTQALASAPAARADILADARVGVLRGGAGSVLVAANPAAEPLDIVLPEAPGLSIPAGMAACVAGPGFAGFTVPPHGIGIAALPAR